MNVIDPAFRAPLYACGGQAASLTIMRKFRASRYFSVVFLAKSYDNAQYFGNREDRSSSVVTVVDQKIIVDKFRVTTLMHVDGRRSHVLEKRVNKHCTCNGPAFYPYPLCSVISYHAEPSTFQPSDTTIVILGPLRPRMWRAYGQHI